MKKKKKTTASTTPTQLFLQPTVRQHDANEQNQLLLESVKTNGKYVTASIGLSNI